MALYLSHSTWEHTIKKSLYKLQVFSWDNEILLFLLIRAKDYACNTEKTPPDLLALF